VSQEPAAGSWCLPDEPSRDSLNQNSLSSILFSVPSNTFKSEALCNISYRVNFLQWWIVSPHPTPNLEDHPCRLSSTAYSVHSQLPSIFRAHFLRQQTWGLPMPLWIGAQSLWLVHLHHSYDLSTRWKWVVSFTPRPLCPQGISLRFPLDGSRSGRCRKEENLCPYLESNLGHQARSPSIYWVSPPGSHLKLRW
jgi:hypothetical protein